MSRYVDQRDPAYEAYAERLAEQQAQNRADGDPMLARDWDRLEAGPWWNTCPGGPS